MPKFLIVPRYECKEAKSKWGATHVISICEKADHPNNAEPTPEGIDKDNHLHYFFDDYNARNEDIVFSGAITKEEVYNILVDGSTRIPDDALVLIHCYAGISRSPAVAFILYCQALGPGQEEEALKMTRASAPYKGIFPNERIVKYADELLERNGIMSKIIKDFKNPIINSDCPEIIF